MVHYQEGNSHSAQISIAIADDIYETITNLYSYEPQKKVSIVLRDRQDYSNGAAYFFDDKIEIWLPSLDTPFRGSHNWLKNVITHEFVHIVQLGASMRRTQRIPAFYLQWLSYEDVRRPDVLYGFPNGIITFPFATVSMPGWFVEGSAQYQTDTLQHDFWDNHRDMMLRTRILADKALTLTEMSHFSSKNSLERELVYNQGFDFVNYLTHQFGEQILADLTHYSAKNKKNNFNTVMSEVTGIHADSLYNSWFKSRKESYQQVHSTITETEVNNIVGEGFLNFYPIRHSVTGNFAFLTNYDRDYSRTSLVIQTDSSDIIVEDMGGHYILDSDSNFHSLLSTESNISVDYIRFRFSFSPEGNQVVYSRTGLNKFGENYNDLYLLDLESEEKKKITKNSRIHDPDWHPFESEIVAVQFSSGTQNLVQISLDSGEIEQLTNFKNGETVYTPVWSPDGKMIYFSKADHSGRQIYQLDTSTNDWSALLHDPNIDFRDPWPHSNNEELYFASDLNGIFNIYSYHLDSQAIKQITNLLGGAFMPSITDSTLYFSDYRYDGYKISSIDLKTNQPILVQKNRFNENIAKNEDIHQKIYSYATDLPFDEALQTEEQSIEVDGSKKIWRPYTETTTGLSVLPVVRFDNYSKLRGSNSTLIRNRQVGKLAENLWRDIKFGAYFSTRDVTEKLSLYGGILIGPGSIEIEEATDFISPTRLNNLDRDVFFVAEYRGIPFIKRSWSPTIVVELYNLKRNVNDGLTIEEFACTSCLPSDRSIDIRYSMWEANLFLRSKLNRWSLLELGIGYSPYSVSTDSFFSEEFQEQIPGATSEYFKGSKYSISYVADLTLPTRHADIAPTGVLTSFAYRFEPGRLLQNFEVNDGILSPLYSRDLNHSIEFNNRVGFSLHEETTAVLTTRGFSFLNRPDDFFYMDYTGGLVGMRSYPFFALGGRQTFFTRISLFHPLFTDINKQFNSATFDKIFAHLFFETGNGWGGPLNIGDNMKSGLGAELRFALNTYYLFPMKFFVNTTYGLNRYNVNLPGEFITSSGIQSVEYGREVLFYFGLTFDFDFR
tara:strand:+ start:47226 stop:50402 length:3177 start_codon:yes stop_codon:yes gene_type:complete